MTAPELKPAVLTIREVQRELGVPYGTAQRITRACGFRGVKCWKVPRTRLFAYLADHPLKPAKERR